MHLRLAIPKVRRHRAAVTGLSIVVAAAMFQALPAAQAVHDEGFALQGNLFGNGSDWEDLFDVAGSPTSTTQKPPADLPTGFTAAAFAKDFVLPDNSGYATGSKDTLPITDSGSGSDWQCKTPNNLGGKFDLVNAYAGSFIPTTGEDAGDLIIFFGSEVSAPEGNRNMGVWLLKDPSVNCSGVGNTDFTGSHKDGDVFVVSAFTNGGAAANIDVYEWDDTTPADNDADNGGVLVKKAGFSNVVCGSASATTDLACAIANTDGDKSEEVAFEVNPPWDAPDKDGGNLNEAQFMEGGVNLTELGIEGCFPTFLANSRSSQETGSTLHDFARSSFQQCGASLQTTPSATSITIGQSLTDSAKVSVTGGANPPAPAGSVTFHVCGPVDDISSCTPTAANSIGAVNLDTATRSGNDYTVSSSSHTPLAAGDYCFAASWPGDSNYTDGPYVDGSSRECFTVTPSQPSISTTHTGAAPGVALGSAISDTATLSGTVSDPDGSAADGTITFRLYGPQAAPATPDCTGTPVYTSPAYPVSGDGTYPTAAQIADVSLGAASFTPTQAGTYQWVATYSGDSPNNLGVASVCGAEASVIFSLQPTMDTAQSFYPNDSATVTVASGAGNLTGDVRFRLYDNSTCADPAGPAGLLYDSGSIDITTGTGTGLSRTVETSNTTVRVNAASTSLSWLVTYVSTNNGIRNVTSACNVENSTVTIDNGTQANTP